MLGGVLGGWEIDIVQYCTFTVPSFDSTDAYLSLCVFVKNFVQYLYFVVIFSAMFVCVFFLNIFFHGNYYSGLFIFCGLLRNVIDCRINFYLYPCYLKTKVTIFFLELGFKFSEFFFSMTLPSVSCYM